MATENDAPSSLHAEHYRLCRDINAMESKRKLEDKARKEEIAAYKKRRDKVADEIEAGQIGMKL